MTPEPTSETSRVGIDFAALGAIEKRLLWLSARMIDHANQRGETEIKVGGHQASCASMATIMTALWFAHIGGEDKVAVKPHASPLYHSIKYLTGELDRSHVTTLRQHGGLQAYPSRTKDPDVADFSTGSVGLGVDRFGESGTIHELYEAFGFLPHQIATAGLVALNLDQSTTNSRSSNP